MVVCLIPWWRIPSWDCTKRLLRLPKLSGILHQGDYKKIYPTSYFWMPLHTLWDWLELVIHCYQHNDIFLHSCYKWCDSAFSWISDPSLFCCLRHPHISCVAKTWCRCWPCWIGDFYYSYNLIGILIGDSVLRLPSLGILHCSERSHFQHAF